ncbi:MAG TPA: hypothetical protein DCX03_07895, partial [Bacteroidales bacterium]|nr:hypothetical protein [Bacteroidales bacterium]
YNKCPICSGRKVVVGQNDLITTHPELAKEWHPTNNGSLTPKDVSSRSNKKVWWLSPEDVSWECQVRLRVKGRVCPLLLKVKF